MKEMRKKERKKERKEDRRKEKREEREGMVGQLWPADCSAEGPGVAGPWLSPGGEGGGGEWVVQV